MTARLPRKTPEHTGMTYVNEVHALGKQTCSECSHSFFSHTAAFGCMKGSKGRYRCHCPAFKRQEAR